MAEKLLTIGWTIRPITVSKVEELRNLNKTSKQKEGICINMEYGWIQVTEEYFNEFVLQNYLSGEKMGGTTFYFRRPEPGVSLGASAKFDGNFWIFEDHE